jgi:hypothetical protein
MIIETGRRLTVLKEQSGHGNWMEVVKEQLGWSIRKADMLMAIGRAFGDWKQVSNLPASWGSLYELTKFTQETLKEKLESGEINSGSERQEVSKLRGSRPAKAKSDPWSMFQKAADKFFEEVQSLAFAGGFSDADYENSKAARDEIVRRLDALMDNLDSITKRKEKEREEFCQ